MPCAAPGPAPPQKMILSSGDANTGLAHCLLWSEEAPTSPGHSDEVHFHPVTQGSELIPAA